MSVITVIGSGQMGSAMSVPARHNGHEVRLVLAVGYGIDLNPNFVKQRKPLEEVVSFNQW